MRQRTPVSRMAFLLLAVCLGLPPWQFAVDETYAGQASLVEIDDDAVGSAGSLEFSSGWTRWAGKQPRGGTLHYANQAGCTLELSFIGTEAHLIHKVGPDCGVAHILVDGRPAAVALPTSTCSSVASSL